MKKFVLKRLGYACVSLFVLSLTIFLFVRITGDPTTLLVEPGASKADIDALKSQLGLDRPIWVQYVSFIPSVILAAVRVNGFWDGAGKIFALLGLSMPQFWVGLLMILLFSVYLGWLPSSGSGTPLHVLMPAFALGWYFAAAHMRLTRSSMLEVLGSEYVKLARLK